MKKKTIMALGLLAAVVITGIVVTKVAGIEGRDAQTISYTAKNTDKAIGTSENPYTVLEIVPEETMATFGYLIPGCEPVALNEIADATTDGAAETYASYYNGTVATVDAVDATVRCYDLPSSVTYPVTPTPEVTTSEGGEESHNYFGELGYYENVGSGNGHYAWDFGINHFVRQEGGTYNWICVGNYTEAVGDEENASFWYRVGSVYTDSADALLEGQEYYHYVSTMQPDAVLFQLTIKSGFDAKEIPQNHTTDTATVTAGSDKLGDKFWCDRTESQWYAYATRNITNNDVLIQNLFAGQSSNEGFCSQVITVTPQQLAGENLAVIDNADMIVIHDMETGLTISNSVNKTSTTKTSFATDNGNDLSWDAVVKIVEKQAGGNPAAMVLDESAIDPNNPTVNGLLNSGSIMSNLSKLYVIMNAYGAKYFYNVYLSGETVSNVAETVFSSASTMDTDTDIIGASNFVYDFSGEDSTFAQAFTDATKLIKTNNTTEAFTNNDQTSMSYLDMLHYLNDEVNGGGSSSYKTSLNILEIQPCNKFIYDTTDEATNKAWKEYYLSLIPWFIGTDKDITTDVHITCMTTYQFIGNIDDLSAKYDLIIIGANQDVSNGLNGYNDTSMGKLAYTAVGDLITTVTGTRQYNTNRWPSANLDNLITKDGDSHYLVASTGGSDASQVGVRYSGTDLTKKKYEELLKYASTNPIVIDGSLYSTDGKKVDDTVVDSSSFTYQLASNALTSTSAENVYNYNFNMSANVNQIKQKAGITHCSFALTQQPKEIEHNSEGMVTSDSVNDQKDSDQNNVLQYTFTLSGDTGTTEVPVTYQVALYIDQNGNGVYEGSLEYQEEAEAFGDTLDTSISEQASNLNIVDITSERPETITDGILYAGHTYTVTRSLPSVEAGILPWKLEVYQTQNHTCRDMVSGYTRVTTANSMETIKILQMNLMPDMTNEASKNNADFSDTSKNVGAKFAEYLSQVQSLGDYSVTIEFMNNNKNSNKGKTLGWYQNFHGKAEEWTEYLNKYDMLILGYNDMACFTNDKDFLVGFQAFIASGKSVILSHDMVADASFKYINSSVVTNSDTSLYLRQLSGQMRKYYVPGSTDYSYSSVNTHQTSVTMLPDKNNFQIGTWWKWNRHWDNGFFGWGSGWVYDSVYPEYYLGYDDYTYETSTNTGVEDVSSLMDNSVRAMINYSMGKANNADHTDRTYNDGKSSGIDYWLNSNTNEKSGATSTVTLANEGQITNYPFKLSSTIQVAPTHAQNYQLDLEYDSGGDVTVWYNLSNSTSNGIYSSKEGDSRNNYYIYTKGNVTYTGLGHSGSMTDDEIKLFVNTMISAYRSQASDPYITVTNPEAVNNGQTSTIYIEDKNSDGSDCTVHLKVNDDTVAAISRTYNMVVKDASGNVIALSGQTANPDGSYTVERGGTYNFIVPYQSVQNASELDYTVTLVSKYMGSNSQISTEPAMDVRTVKVLFMPLFDLY